MSNKEQDHTSDFEKKLKRAVVNRKNKELKKEWEKKLAQQYGINKRSKKNFRMGKWVLAVAASLLLIASAFFLVDTNSKKSLQFTESLISSAPLIQHPTSGFRGDGSEKSASEVAYEKMKEKDYAQAVMIYQALHDAQEYSAHDQYYMALAYLRSNQSQKAIDLLSVPLIEKSRYKEEAKWLLALSYAKTKDDRLNPLLEEIISNHLFKWQEAKKLKSFL